MLFRWTGFWLIWVFHLTSLTRLTWLFDPFSDTELDMRMNQAAGLNAKEVGEHL